MTVAKFIELARYGELNSLYLKEDTQQNNEIILGFVELGLIELYKRFSLKTREQLITLGYTQDATDPLNISSTTTPSSILTEYQLNDDVLTIQSIYNSAGELYTINNEQDYNSVFTTDYNTIQVPNSISGTNLSVVYTAAPPSITYTRSTTSVAKSVRYTVNTNSIGMGILYQVSNTISGESLVDANYQYPLSTAYPYYVVEPAAEWTSGIATTANTTAVKWRGEYYICIQTLSSSTVAPDVDTDSWRWYPKAQHRILANMAQKLLKSNSKSGSPYTITTDGKEPITIDTDLEKWLAAGNTINHIDVTVNQPGEDFVSGVNANMVTTTTTANVTGVGVAYSPSILPISSTFIEPLLFYVGYRGHGSYDGKINTESNTHLMRYEASIRKIIDNGYVTPDDSVYIKFSDRGFV